jgi:hypothetical protein
VIERIFGVIKRKYKILNTPPEYSIDTQSDLILGLAALHNFCRGLDGSKVDDYITELEGSEDILERLRHSTSAICGKIGENKDTVSQVD